MNWMDYLPGIAAFVLAFGLGGLTDSLIRKYRERYRPFIPEIPHVRVGSQVMIGDDLYVLKAYHYKEKNSTADSERTVIFKSVPTHEREAHE